MRVNSEQDRRQPCAYRFVVKTHCHKVQRLDDPQTVIEAPAQQACVAGRNDEAGTFKRLGRGEQRLEIVVTLRDGVPEESEDAGVTGDTAVALYHYSRGLLDCIPEFSAPIVAVDLLCEPVAFGQVRNDCFADAIPGDVPAERRTLHHRERLTDRKPQACIERQRSIVECRLYEPDSGEAACPRAIEYRLHQSS